jgi:hypothetical protein
MTVFAIFLCVGDDHRMNTYSSVQLSFLFLVFLYAVRCLTSKLLYSAKEKDVQETPGKLAKA